MSASNAMAGHFAAFINVDVIMLNSHHKDIN